ncbi:MAG: hypothetical protein ICV68_02790 [Pyrinomonadaceae bacterium]|nr:hypothetical protein [Pyrinomonadaceae bacterium]
MQAVTATLKQDTRVGRRSAWSQIRAAAHLWLTRIFGCWHQEMSRPFTLGAKSYRVCLECGAHRRFDAQRWEMTGPYYYEAADSLEELYAGAKTEKVSVRRARRNERSVLRAAA